MTSLATPVNPEPVDYSRKWYVMLAVAMGVFLATIDGSIVNVSLPTMVEALDTDFATIQWVVLSYLLTITTLQTIVGRLADMYGKKRLYTLGFVVFTAGSLLCGLAPTVGWLIGFRVLQGVGAALILALGLAILTEAFPPGERGRALGIGGSIVSIGIVTGPTFGRLHSGASALALDFHCQCADRHPGHVSGNSLRACESCRVAASALTWAGRPRCRCRC